MNLLFISSKTGWGGIMSWMVLTAEGMQKRNHNVLIVSNPRSKLNQKNYPHLNIIEKRLGFDYNPYSIIYLTNQIRRHKIQCVVTNIRKEVIAGGQAAKLCKIPNVRRIGLSVDLNERVKQLHKNLITHSIIPCDYIFNDASLKNDWLKRENFTTIYNGRNAVEFDESEIQRIRNLWGVSDNTIVIGTTVKLSKIKNVAGLVKVFSALLKDYENIKLVVAGTGPEEQNLRDLVQSLNISSHVFFNGFTHEAQLIAACYDIAVLNSDEEGFPNTLVEYLSAGTAAIAANVGGTDEILRNGYNGLMISPQNEEELLSKLRMLIEDKELRGKLGYNAIHSVKEKFSLDSMIDNLEKVFERVVADARVS